MDSVLHNGGANTLGMLQSQTYGFLFSLSTAISLSPRFWSRSEAIMIGKDSSGPRDKYLRESRRGFNLSALGEETDSEED